MAKDKSANETGEPVKISKWDATAVKNALDDGIKEILIERIELVEDHSLMDGRLIICTVAVAIAIFALLWDYLHPFPQSWLVLLVCASSYFFLMFILSLYTTYKEKGIFVVARQKDRAGVDPDGIWEAASAMKKFDDMYELSLTFTDGKTGKSRENSFNRSCAEFFDENGVLCADLLENAVMKLYKGLANEKKDS